MTMPEWERVKQIAEEIAPGSTERGEWATTHKQNETLDKARDFLDAYADLLKEEESGEKESKFKPRYYRGYEVHS